MNEIRTEKKVCELCGTGYLKGFEGKLESFMFQEIEGDSEKNLEICGECRRRIPEFEIDEEDRISTLTLSNFADLEFDEGTFYSIGLECYNCNTKGQFLILFEKDKLYVSNREMVDTESDYPTRPIEIFNEDYPQIWCDGCYERNLYSCGSCGEILYSDETEVVDGETYCPDCYLEAILEEPSKVYRNPLATEIVRKAVNINKSHPGKETELTSILKKFGWTLGKGMRTYDKMSGGILSQYNNDDLETEVKEMLKERYEYIPLMVAEHNFCVNIQIAFRKRI